MTSAHHAGRLYALALTLVVFFLTWAVVAARPWASTSTQVDPRLAALAVRERQVQRESLAVRRIVARRWAVYRAELRRRQAQIAAVHREQAAAAAAAASAPVAGPSVRVVTLPPLTITRTS